MLPPEIYYEIFKFMIPVNLEITNSPTQFKKSLHYLSTIFLMKNISKSSYNGYKNVKIKKINVDRIPRNKYFKDKSENMLH